MVTQRQKIFIAVLLVLSEFSYGAAAAKGCVSTNLDALQRRINCLDGQLKSAKTGNAQLLQQVDGLSRKLVSLGLSAGADVAATESVAFNHLVKTIKEEARAEGQAEVDKVRGNYTRQMNDLQSKIARLEKRLQASRCANCKPENDAKLLPENYENLLVQLSSKDATIRDLQGLLSNRQALIEQHAGRNLQLVQANQQLECAVATWSARAAQAEAIRAELEKDNQRLKRALEELISAALQAGITPGLIAIAVAKW